MTEQKRDIQFTKMAGTGNDFIVIDNRLYHFSGRENDLFRHWCTRRLSIGADGLLLLQEGEVQSLAMRYFNSDGHEAEMCGNGARCMGYFIWRNGLVQQPSFHLEASDGVHSIEIMDNTVALSMMPPREYEEGCHLVQRNDWKEGGFLNTGVPHYVIFADEIDRIDVENSAPFFRHHERFEAGVNVNFVQINRENLRVRTFERGVEAETLSCGTGCVASALIASKQFDLKSPVSVSTRGGELKVRFNSAWDEVYLEGPVQWIYDARIGIEI